MHAHASVHGRHERILRAPGRSELYAGNVRGKLGFGRPTGVAAVQLMFNSLAAASRNVDWRL